MSHNYMYIFKSTVLQKKKWDLQQIKFTIVANLKKKLKMQFLTDNAIMCKSKKSILYSILKKSVRQEQHCAL